MKSGAVRKVTVSALLIAIGIMIPMFMPVKVVIPPASFTLASHVPIFLAMLISPAMAVAVAVGTTIGFFFSTPLVIALRAATHIVFALIGGFYLQKRPEILSSIGRVHLFSFVIGIIHAVCEVAVVTAFYLGGNMGEQFYQHGFIRSVILLIGVGSVVHSMVDFEISLIVYKALSKQRGFVALQQ